MDSNHNKRFNMYGGRLKGNLLMPKTLLPGVNQVLTKTKSDAALTHSYTHKAHPSANQRSLLDVVPSVESLNSSDVVMATPKHKSYNNESPRKKLKTIDNSYSAGQRFSLPPLNQSP